jgi:hypothetical protein
VLNMRHQRLRPLLHDFDAVLARPIPKQVEALQLLSNYIDGLIKTPTLSADATRLVVLHLYDLAALACGAVRDAAEIAKGRGLRAARLHAIKADIAEKLADPNLSVKAIAMRHRVSSRYIQMLFEQARWIGGRPTVEQTRVIEIGTLRRGGYVGKPARNWWTSRDKAYAVGFRLCYDLTYATRQATPRDRGISYR